MNVTEMKILVCDDSILARKKIKDCILSLGCSNVFEACDGVEAVDQYKSCSPHLVFMDIVMPNKDGIEAVMDILAYDKDAKIVMASSAGTQTFLKEAIKAGAIDFLQKPIESEQVKKVILSVAKGVN